MSGFAITPEIVESIRHLRPARVLDVGGALAARLRSLPAAVETDETAAGPYDLVVWLNPGDDFDGIRRWAALTDTILAALPDTKSAAWLEAFLEAGFFPDLSYRGPAVLLRRGSPASRRELAVLLSELLRLRAEEAEAASLEHRMEFLQSVVDDLRRQTASVVESRTWRILTGAAMPLTGLRRLGRRLARGEGCQSVPTPERYHRWIGEYERREPCVARPGPLLSVVAPGERMLASLREQCYRGWEAVASLDEAGGDYVFFPGPKDEFSPDALQNFAEAAGSGADLVYSDEDTLDSTGVRTAPLFKPDWSPYLLASQNYIGRAMMLRRSLAGGAAGPYELALRAGNRVAHLPRVLYHARGAREPGSREAIERSLPGTGVEEGLAPGCWRVRYPPPSFVPVEVLVPSRSAALLDRCLNSVRANTAYPSFSLTVIDNADGGLRAVAERYGARLVDWRRRRFNYSAMNNEAALGSAAPLLLFLNDDTTVIEPGWMEAMVELALRPDVGAVGARLLYPSGAIQHAGVVIGIYGVCGHAFKGCAANAPSYLNLAHTVRDVSAVTGACLMVRAEVFREAGGFDAADFPVAYNDIDLCLRIRGHGRRVLYTPHALLYHHEARSKPWRLRRPARDEVRAFQSRWREYIARDPFYSPNLTRAAENYALRSRACEL